MANNDAAVPEVIGERIGHLLIEKRQQTVAGVDQIDLDVQAAENRRILAADDACAIDNDVAWLVVQVQNGVGVVNARVGKIDISRMVRTGTAGDNEFFRRQALARAVVMLDFDGVGIDKVGVALKQFAAVALVKALAHRSLLADDVLRVVQDIGERGAQQASVIAVKRVLVEFNNATDCMAKRFGGNGAPVGTTAADVMVAFDHCDARSLLHQAHGCTFTSRTGANHDGIVIVRLLHTSTSYFLYIFTTRF